MNAHILTLIITTVFAATSFAQTTPAGILDEYHQKSASALKRINETLESQGVTIAASLVSQGDTTGADELSKQIKSKISGEAVLKPHSSVVMLFRQYDSAREAILKPIQAASIAKIDAMLKTTAGKKMGTVLELAKNRQTIEGGKVNETPALQIPEFWTYHSTPESTAVMANFQFKPDGTYIITGGRNGTELGTWKPTKVPNIITLQNNATIWKITFEGDKATIDRPDMGLRYLRVKPTTSP